MKRIFFVSTFQVLTFCGFAQNEANIWYFGYAVGLDFNNGAPKILNDIPNNGFNALEGCAVQSNQEGQLLFYTDGQSVYDFEHNLMDNGGGLLGHENSSQAALIVPWPENDNKFFVFTTDNQNDKNGLRYSVIDLSLNNGKGSVTLEKNIILKTPVTEGLTATRHADGINYWVIAHDWGNNNFLVYLVDSKGVNSNPIISSIGQIRNSKLSSVSYHKLSPNSEMIISTGYKAGIVDLFKFNNSNGKLSSHIELPSNGWDWGCSFSPDNSKLYILTTEMSLNILVQYDVSDYNKQEILNSEIKLSNIPTNIGGMQIAVDGKIYICENESEHLSILDCPNSSGLTGNYLEKSLFLGGRKSRWSPPNFIDDQLEGTEITDECGICLELTDPNFNQSCIDCAGTPNGTAIVDKCGICLEPTDPYFNESCIDCKGVLNGTAVVDDCGECLEPSDLSFNTACADCVGTPNGTAVLDDCGECRNPSDPDFNMSCAEEIKIFVPNAFSPNGDGLNDEFVVYKSKTTNARINKYQIFNRWGELIFESRDFDFHSNNNWWNGEFKGKKVKSGVYIYSIEINFHNYGIKKRKGRVLIII